jgi:hypothetical protein
LKTTIYSLKTIQLSQQQLIHLVEHMGQGKEKQVLQEYGLKMAVDNL